MATYHVDWGKEQRYRGSYGLTTMRALKNFQATHNLELHVLIGHDTARWHALRPYVVMVLMKHRMGVSGRL